MISKVSVDKFERVEIVVGLVDLYVFFGMMKSSRSVFFFVKLEVCELEGYGCYNSKRNLVSLLSRDFRVRRVVRMVENEEKDD